MNKFANKCLVRHKLAAIHHNLPRRVAPKAPAVVPAVSQKQDAKRNINIAMLVVVVSSPKHRNKKHLDEVQREYPKRWAKRNFFLEIPSRSAMSVVVSDHVSKYCSLGTLLIGGLLDSRGLRGAMVENFKGHSTIVSVTQ